MYGVRGQQQRVMPIIKVDVHTPIFYFPKLKNVGCEERFKYKQDHQKRYLILVVGGWMSIDDCSLLNTPTTVTLGQLSRYNARFVILYPQFESGTELKDEC